MVFEIRCPCLRPKKYMTSNSFVAKLLRLDAPEGKITFCDDKILNIG